MVSIPPGSAWLKPGGGERLAVQVGRFADEPSYPLAISGGGARIALPDIEPEGEPWKLLLYGERPVTVCASGDS